jgi:hypothetical protein
MRLPSTILSCALTTWLARALPTALLITSDGAEVSQPIFTSLEELARIVDISYCVGTTGIQKPFKCLSRCKEFDGFELVTTWNTGPLLSDSSGYIAISHPPHPKRVIVAFRGTYSIANTIADLSTNPAEYAPFPSEGNGKEICTAVKADALTAKEPLLPQLLTKQEKRNGVEAARCDNCTVHSGFMTSWRNTRCIVMPHVETALNTFPEYELVLVGHSLGGAVAALAALELQARGYDPHVTTFGEPRIGNAALAYFLDKRFNMASNSTDPEILKYRRVTHMDDPVPLLPLEEWGYRMHAGEIYISKAALPPARTDVRHCVGAEDRNCINDRIKNAGNSSDASRSSVEAVWEIGKRYKLWELFFAHRDYFWRLGLCVPGSDPWDWGRGKYNVSTTNDEL